MSQTCVIPTSAFALIRVNVVIRLILSFFSHHYTVMKGVGMQNSEIVKIARPGKSELAEQILLYNVILRYRMECCTWILH